jgi:hypothetical protein
MEIVMNDKDVLNMIERMKFFIDNYYPEDLKITTDTFINDMIYALGLSVNESKYKWAEGYSDWKDYLEFNIIKGNGNDIRKKLKSTLDSDR